MSKSKGKGRRSVSSRGGSRSNIGRSAGRASRGSSGASGSKSGSVGSRRSRPSTKAKARQVKTRQRPLPKPPSKRSPSRDWSSSTASPTAVSRSVSNSSPAVDNTVAMATAVMSNFERLESAAQLPDIYDAIGEIDRQLTELPFSLERLRTRGYVHSGQLEDKLEALDDKWDEIRPQIERTLKLRVTALDNELDQTERVVDRLARIKTASLIRTAETAVEGLDRQVVAARESLTGLYTGLDQELDKIDYQIRRIDSMLDLIDESQEVRMREAEAPLLAVKAEWHQNGDDGPEGVLIMTDQRLLFEQREEVVTKKRFGLFKAESEMVQKLLLQISIPEIESVVSKEEGGFLGMGKDDILELVCAGTAPVSRARFHLQGQESADWATKIKHVQTGQIDEERADDYLEELAAAEVTAASFPEMCPSCFASVPTQPRGITAVTCGFCGHLIEPQPPNDETMSKK